VQVIENVVDIDRDSTAVFDYCSDMRTEADWNPALQTVALLTPEPVGLGSRFEVRARDVGRSTMEVVEFHRPVSWTARTVGAALPARLVGTVEPLGVHAARLTMRIELSPNGLLRMLGPIMAVLVRRTARGNVLRIKHVLEGQVRR
jgi:hypothetical protein